MLYVHTKEKPRPAASYRAARRNHVLRRVGGGVWHGVEPKVLYQPRFRLNRSRHLDGKPTLTPYGVS